MNKKEILQEIDKLLQKWELYFEENKVEIENILERKNHYDMMLNVDIMEEQAKIYMFERGVQIYQYRTDSKDIVIYTILEEIVDGIIDVFVTEMYATKRETLEVALDLAEYKKKLKSEAFLLMGNPYFRWYKAGITLWNYEVSITQFPKGYGTCGGNV